MTMESSDIWWLVVVSVTSAITTALLHAIAGFVKSVKATIKLWIFQYLAERFDVSSHTFSQLNNGSTMPRLLEQIRLRSWQYMWVHEANAASKDSVQYGYIRLPTKSAVCKLLAFFHIVHYVWSSSDLQTIHIISSTKMVFALIKMSNSAAAKPMTEKEEESLREAFGCDNYVTEMDLTFISYERYTLFAFTAISIFVTCIVHRPHLIFISLLLSFCTFCHSWSLIAAMWVQLRSCSRYDMAVGFRSRKKWLTTSFRNKLRSIRGVREVGGVAPLLNAESDEGRCIRGRNPVGSELGTLWNVDGGPCSQSSVVKSAEQEALTAMEVNSEASTVEVAAATVSSIASLEMIETTDAIESSTARSYSLVLSVEYYYANWTMNISSPYSSEISPCKTVCMYAVMQCPNFCEYVASMVNTKSMGPKNSPGLVYVCVYNPMTDPPLFCLSEFISKGQKESPIFLVIILPPIETLEAALKEKCGYRLRSQKCTQYIATLADFEDFLMKASTGFLAQELAFVIPVAASTSETHLKDIRVWKSAKALLGDKNCCCIAKQSQAA